MNMLSILFKTVKPAPPEIQPVDITLMLKQWNAGDEAARDNLIDYMYPELKRIAHARMRSERDNHSLQATALVSEFFLQMARREDVVWQNRGHFLATAARSMKRLLIDHARARLTVKRGSGEPQLQINFLSEAEAGSHVDILDFNRHLDRLWAEEPRMAQVVELHCFGGLTHGEIAEVIGVDERTIRRDWRMAKAWMVSHLKKG